MSMDFDRFCFMVLLSMPYAVELSVLKGVAGCLWPSSSRVVRRGAAVCAFWNHAPTSDSAADATIFFIAEATFRMEPFSLS
jgi:hypothetical protein